MPATLGRLRLKLALSYAMVTALATFAWLMAVWLLTTWLLFYSSAPAYALLRYVIREAESVRPALLAQPPDLAGLEHRIAEYRRAGDWQVINELGFHYALSPDPDEALLVITDASGTILASNAASAQAAEARLTATTRRLRANALAGGIDPTQSSARDAGGVAVAAPIFDNSGKVLGTFVVVHDSAFWADPLNHMLSTVVYSLLPNFLLIVPFSLLFGFVAGLLASRALVTRIDRVALVSLRWSAGDLGAAVNDSNQDELGQLSQRLDAMAKQLGRLMKSRQESASLEERNRIARELHDSAKQQSYAVAGQLAAARVLIKHDLPAAELRLADAEKLNDALRAELAGLILELRPPELARDGLSTALAEYVAAWSRHTGVESTVDLCQPPNLDEQAEQALFRITQEALSNVVRHSGARHLAVRLALRPGDRSAVLTISDDGRGFTPGQRSDGFGLTSMRQRAEAVGAQLELASRAGQGTTVTVIAHAKG